MLMASYLEMQFKHALRKPVSERTPEDLDIIHSFLHGLEALSCLREPALRSICASVRYESHKANDILYCRGQLASCWYILLSGSVFIDGSMYLPCSSFGKRMAGCPRRASECLILEASEMIVIDYPDVQLMRPGSRFSTSSGVSLDPLDHPHHVAHRLCRSSSGDSLPRELQSGPQPLQPLLLRPPDAGPHHVPGKRGSRAASDTSSAYSGSDLMQSSLDDQDMDLTGLVESNVDSDDEEDDTGESLIVRDTVRECLEKDPAERTEDDIEVLLEFMQHLPAFANMTLATRRALCAVMVFAVVQKENTVVMNDGEELDSWSVILNGHVEIQRPDGTIEHLHMGDSFGITPTMEKLYHKGVMRTKVDDCQFVCIAQADYYRILHQGEENTHRVTEQGEVVLVTEHRTLDGGSRKGAIVIRGTPEKLMTHLVEQHSAVDPTYVEDFLLTYRTFLRLPTEVADRLLVWFKDQSLRDRVTRVVLLWVNNHFNDFENEPRMSDFLERFEHQLEKERMGGQLRLLNIACAAKARPRQITLRRNTREEILHFSVLGGLERGCGIFVTKVERGSKASEAGLKRGDQILEVNNQSFEHISHQRALDILRGTTHLAITVKSNLLAFKEMLSAPSEGPPLNRLQADHKQRLSTPTVDVQGSARLAKAPPPKATKIRKALQRFNILPRNVSSDSQLNRLDPESASGSSLRGSRKGSASSSANSSPLHTPKLSASNPDLSTIGQYDDDKSFPEHVLKVYRNDQTCKYFLVHKETTAHEVVMLALREFGITEASNNYSLCEVTVEEGHLVKQKRLPDQLSNLPDRISLNGRYYLKNNLSTDALVPDELTGELEREAHVSFLQLNSAELAAQLTLRDFQLFHCIESTEYIDDLFELESKTGTPRLAKFSELVNKEMFWVVTEVCCEASLVKRMKIIKQFIKIARHCKECKNFNSMFAIISGLGHRAVSRLRQAWDKLPSKYQKLFEDLQDIMDPSRNMSKYRNLISSEMVHPPLIPFFPVVKKDLTFIHLGNDSRVDGLINFEKLRMIAKEVRHVTNMASAQYDLGTMLASSASSGVFSAFSGGSATLRRQRRKSTLPNPRKMFEEAQMVRRVRSYLSNMRIIEDEDKLSEMSNQCEPPVNGAAARKRDPSPNPAAVTNLGPKFDPKRNSGADSPSLIPKSLMGAESPEAVRKLMALTDKVQPHNRRRHPLPPLLPPSSPSANKRPVSPRNRRTHAPPPPVAVNLSAESSSVAGISHRKTASTASSEAASTASTSPTNSVGSSTLPTDTDSGHVSTDAHSQSSSIGSVPNSPPSCKRSIMHPLPVMTAKGRSQPQSRPPTTLLGNGSARHDPGVRPPLPPYHVVVQNNPGYSQYIQQQYQMMSQRPPDYHLAMQQQQQLQKRKAQYSAYHSRSRSCDGGIPGQQDAFYGGRDEREELVDDPDATYEVEDDEEEIVSAV